MSSFQIQPCAIEVFDENFHSFDVVETNLCVSPQLAPSPPLLHPQQQRQSSSEPYYEQIFHSMENQELFPKQSITRNSKRGYGDFSSVDTSHEENDDDTEEDLLSISSIASDLILPQKKGYNHRRAHQQQNHSVAPKVKLFRQANGIALDLPWKFGNLIAKGFNNHDNNQLRHLFHEYFTPDCSVIKRVYSTANPKTKNPKNYFGKYSTTTMTLQAFADYSKNFDIIVPDAVIEVGNHRSCYEREVSVFMSTFKYTGTIITPDAILVETDKSGRVQQIKNKENPQKVLGCYPQHALNPFESLGSMAIYVNTDGLIYCLEFFYEFA